MALGTPPQGVLGTTASALPKAIGVLTSVAAAPGMNAALRAVVRTALNRGVAVYAISFPFGGLDNVEATTQRNKNYA